MAGKITVFSLNKVQRLRQSAQTASEVSEDGPEGWSKSDVDPMQLLSVFSVLRLKEGYVLRAYQFRSSGNGNGIIWAMPEKAPFPNPKDCIKLQDGFLEPPKPPDTLDHFMDAIEGDQSLWSYLSASLFFREACEFGAIWHGCSWSEHRILGSNPWTSPQDIDEEDEDADNPSEDIKEWKWIGQEPSEWQPQVKEAPKTMRVTFYTFTGLGVQSIYENVDTYKPPSYKSKCKNESIAEGPHGYVH